MRCASSSVLWSCRSAWRSLSWSKVSVLVMAFQSIGTDQVGANTGISTPVGIDALLRAPIEIRRGPTAVGYPVLFSRRSACRRPWKWQRLGSDLHQVAPDDHRAAVVLAR